MVRNGRGRHVITETHWIKLDGGAGVDAKVQIDDAGAVDVLLDEGSVYLTVPNLGELVAFVEYHGDVTVRAES